jgi:pilus assembly protein CpaD
MISEKESVLDLPVGANDRGATKSQAATLAGFLEYYDRRAAPMVNIITPVGSLNEAAAAKVARELSRVARWNGVPKGRIAISTYQAGAPDVSAPIRISYAGVKAHTNQCGRWPEDLTNTAENKHYADFGCSYQNNLAAQIANPTDLLGPRKQTTIDAENRSVVIDDYRVDSQPFEPNIDY